MSKQLVVVVVVRLAMPPSAWAATSTGPVARAERAVSAPVLGLVVSPPLCSSSVVEVVSQPMRQPMGLVEQLRLATDRQAAVVVAGSVEVGPTPQETADVAAVVVAELTVAVEVARAPTWSRSRLPTLEAEAEAEVAGPSYRHR